MSLSHFEKLLERENLHAFLRDDTIGEGLSIETPFGEKPLIYADYVASGRALGCVENFIQSYVLPYYANSHTEASYCGAAMTRLREEARARVGEMVGAGAEHSVVFTGAGATSGINRLVALLDIKARVSKGERIVILIGPYEHHSNILPWRETGAEVVEINEGKFGGPDLEDLKAKLTRAQSAHLIVGSFSAASNVTGILTDTNEVTRVLKAFGALAIWDFAGGAPYVRMNMERGSQSAKDAIVFSPHKFLGGPAASGVMVLRTNIVDRKTPSAPGGGTVRFVSPNRHEYSHDLSTREEAGTPNVIGDIRACLAMMVKAACDQNWLDERHANLRARALTAWRDNPRIELMGHLEAQALPIFSFRIRDGQGGYIHHQLFTRMLSDLYGIQARGGCACAGPYAHRLLGLDAAASDALFDRIEAGDELAKPGWVRLNLSAFMAEEKVNYILKSVESLATSAGYYAQHYSADGATARFAPTAA